jgi:dihydrofolate reductase
MRTRIGEKMAQLRFSMLCSLDGYIEDSAGEFRWAAPDEEVARFVNEQERPVGIYLYGRRMYEVMVFWETVTLDEGASPGEREWTGIWRNADKIVYSRTLKSASSARTRIEPTFDPQAVRELKSTSPCDISVAGPDLAGQAIRAGLVDELDLYVAPVIVGGGKPVLPSGVRCNLELVDTRRFASGFVFLRYRFRGG